MPVLPPEARLLLFATRAPSPEEDRALAELIRQPLDWRFVGELAEREKLLPVLWNRLHNCAATVPATIADRIHAQAAVTEFRMAMTEATLQEVVKRLAAEGIPAMLLKGAALATTVYPSFAARPMGDLDILVRPADAQRAWQYLVDDGWRVEFSGGERFYEGHHHLVALVDPRGLHLVLEIHRAMMPTAGPFLLDEAEVWRDARPVRLGSTQAWVPSDQHLLLHLCVHFAWSNMLFSGLGRTVRDISTLLEAGTIDWADFVRLAHHARAGTCAYWTLAMAQTLAGARVPESVLNTLRPRRPVSLTAALERAHISSALIQACPSIHLHRWLWSAAIRPGASGHGNARPWKVGETFAEVFRTSPQLGRGARLHRHLRGWAGWLRYAKTVGIPKPLI